MLPKVCFSCIPPQTEMARLTLGLSACSLLLLYLILESKASFTALAGWRPEVQVIMRPEVQVIMRSEVQVIMRSEVQVIMRSEVQVIMKSEAKGSMIHLHWKSLVVFMKSDLVFMRSEVQSLWDQTYSLYEITGLVFMKSEIQSLLNYLVFMKSGVVFRR